MLKKWYWWFLSFLLLAPFGISFAQFGTQAPPSSGGTGIPNPLRDEYTTLAQFLNGIVDFLLFLAIPFAIFFMVYAGFLFVTARGNQEQLKTAKKALVWTLIGVAVLLGAKVIATAIQGTIDLIKR